MFDAARTTATILAVIGVGAAALVAYRRQDTAELTYKFNVEAHQVEIDAQKTAGEQLKVSIDAQKTAAEQLQLDSQKYDLDRQRHQLEEERRKDDRERELRARFKTTFEQLVVCPANNC